MKQSKKHNKHFNKTSKGGETIAHEPIQAEPLQVRVYGNFDKALRTFRALVQKERVLSSYKEKQHYEKPSDKRRRKRNESLRKQFEMCSKGHCTHSDHFHKKTKKH